MNVSCILTLFFKWAKSIQSKIIRIYHECEGRIEKNRLEDRRLTSRGLPSDDNGDPEERILLSYLHTNNGFFFLLNTVFFIIIYFKISFQKSLNTLRCNFT